jgi:membrane complex biogenesis BtpA family protein
MMGENMEIKWVKELFGTNKPIIAMCHMNALPGDPGYNPEEGMKQVVAWARKDLNALQDGGVDAVMFSNEFSLPYLTQVEPITIAAMARVIGELLKDIRIPFGVNVLWDPVASLDLAVVVGGKFVREIFTGVYASDYGLWNTNCGATVRHQHRISGKDVKLFYNIVPESAAYLGGRDVVAIAQSTVFNDHPDALCVSGLTAGVETDTSILKKVKEVVPDTVVIANTGMRVDNIEQQLSIADGAIVGTTFKYDGKFENHVDEQRVGQFMEKVKSFRKKFD